MNPQKRFKNCAKRDPLQVHAPPASFFVFVLLVRKNRSMQGTASDHPLGGGGGGGGLMPLLKKEEEEKRKKTSYVTQFNEDYLPASLLNHAQSGGLNTGIM